MPKTNGGHARCDSYIEGECTWGACELAVWLPEWLGNARDWTAHARAKGYAVTMTPTVGSVVVYGGGGGYSLYGHAGYVERVNWSDFPNRPTTFQVKEMNYVRWNAYDERTSSLHDVIGFILAPGVNPGDGGAGPPLGPSSNITALELAWAGMQQLWGSQLDTVVNGGAGLIGSLNGMIGR